MSTFNRTIIFCKERMRDGTFRISKLGWELIDKEGTGVLISQAPIRTGNVESATTFQDLADMLWDTDINSSVEQIVDIMYLDSEADFQNRFDNVNSMYIGSGDNVSGQLGYPRSN